ncbi:chemotaxis protein CheW [Terrisporobacter petrolearius]|uniref:chemotaxis protein CheW n=1 Tax=Terrisporobacter petrolearius TaxID=1460447 RepID=UPI003AFFFB28
MSGIDSMNEFYVQENMQLLEQLEEILLVDHSDTGGLAKEEIEEIFRAMHTIKGSSAMMGYDSLTTLTHCIEDVFDEIRKGLEVSAEKWEQIIDVVLLIIDFLKEEISNIQQGLLPESSIDELHDKVLNLLKDNEKDSDESTLDMDFNLVEEDINHQTKEDNDESELIGSEKKYCIKVLFENGCGMEGIRALGVTTSIEDLCTINETIPADLMGDCDEEIIKDGFTMYVKTENDKSALEKCLQETMFLKTLQITEISKSANKVEEIEEVDEVNLKPDEEVKIATDTQEKEVEIVEKSTEINKINEDLKSNKDNHKEVEGNKKDKVSHIKKENKNSYLTVNIDKIDSLMNLVGEIVTTESMVEKQSQLDNFDPDNFEKQARRLHQLTNELQDVVMSIRMVPISSTFTKMQRVVRDMSKKTGKKVDLVLIGEQTEVDKNILENISDPLMHMVRNSMDHGIETPEERKNTTKPEKATLTLEAKNTGGDILIIIKDDGRGLNKETIVNKAIEKGVTSKSINEISDKEAYNFILAPGFSTKEAVTEYSGRGVGMDVVYTNIRKLRGSISIDSEYGKGTTFTIRIPLTLAIVDGMKIKNDNETYIIPSLNIKEVFRYGAYDIVENPNGEEHSIIRGNCYKICRLSKTLGLSDIKKEDGIMILVESEMGNICLIVDSILGQQQVVIKPIPTILTQFIGVQSYLAGCSILEDGSISLILDVNAMIHR